MMEIIQIIVFGGLYLLKQAIPHVHQFPGLTILPLMGVPFPFLPIALVVSSLISSLFGGGKQQQTTTQETQTEQRRPKDPLYYALSPMLAKALLGRVSQLSGAGMPGGIGSFDQGMMDQFSAMLGTEWPKIMGQYTNTEQPKKYAPYSW